MTTEISIHPVTDQLIETIYNLMLGYFNFYNVDPPGKTKLVALIEKLMASSDNSTQFLADYNGTYCGFVTLYEIWSTLTAGKVILMNDLYVSPEYRGKGVGDKLFKYAANYTKSLGYPKMEWMTEPDNYKARRFYDNRGGTSSKWRYYSLIIE